MTVERRIKTTMGVLLLFALGTVMILFWTSRQVEEGIKRVDSASEAVKTAFMLSVLMNEYLDHESERSLRQWELHRAALGKILKEMNSESIDQTLLGDLQISFQAVDSLSPQLMQMASRENDGGFEDRRIKEMLGSLMSLRLEQLVNTANDVSRATQTMTLNRRYFVQKIIVTGGISLIIIILINIYLIRKSVIRPLKVLASGVEKTGTGELNSISEIKSDDEVGKLARAFNSMVERVRERTEELKSAKDELEQNVSDRTAELRLTNEKLLLEIEERQRAEQAVEAERQRLYSILEAIPMMVCLLTPDHHVAFANRGFREKFGDNNGRHCFDYCFGKKEPCEFCESYNVLNTGKPHHWELTAPDGTILDAYDFPFLDTDGSPLVLEIDIDITEQRHAQEAVKNERQRLYNVLETLPVYVCLLDSNYHMPFANRYFRETFGESLGRSCYDFLFNRTEPCETCETYTVMRTGAPHHWCWTGPNGRDYEIYDFPFIDEHGSMLILEMGIDVTERNRAENALKETLSELTRSNQDLEKFAYVASHDLQEPLRSVAGALQLLEKRYKGQLGSDADRFIGFAVDSAKAMKQLIEDLLTYSRIGTRGNPFRSVAADHALDRALANLRSAVSKSRAEITRSPLPEFVADPSQLTQVFQNLVGNAIKFRRESPPRIHIAAIREEDKWILSVKDNGIGIEKRHLDRIFVIFQRLHKKTEYEGTGIGLAIAKKIVERHGGRIWAESEFGQGATFYFTMPIREETHQEKDANGLMDRHEDGGNPTR